MKIFQWLILLFLTQPVVVAANDWQEISVPNQQTVVVRGTQKKTIYPACAFSYFDSSRFHFYFKKGRADKLAVFFNGGGSCWNDKTCITSLRQGTSSYNPLIDKNNSPKEANGIADAGNKANPFKDWSLVFIPYCTGDLHIGSNDQNYTDVDGVLVGKNATVKVQHRGFDNFLAVREWLKNRYAKPDTLKKLAVMGSSAGAYGATFNFPYWHDLFPKADTVMLSDGGLGITTQDFVDQVFRNGSVWRTEATLVKNIAGLKNYGRFDANTLNETIMQGLASTYKKSRFAQYSTAWDSVQVQFLNIMNSSTEGLPWSDIPPQATFSEWNQRAKQSIQAIKASNYHFYFASGSSHTILGTDKVYTEQSANNLLFSAWLNGFVTHNKNWRSVLCTEPCN